MRRAVRDYKYEVNEGRMTEECIQYLTQLQKDWERHRVKLGVEAMKREVSLNLSLNGLDVDFAQLSERERDRDDTGSISSLVNDAGSVSRRSPSLAPSESTLPFNQSIDALFDKSQDKAMWEPQRPSQVLGELLDSRHMLPLLFPSDPRMLAARPGKGLIIGDHKRVSIQSSSSHSSRASMSGAPLSYRTRGRKIREVRLETLQVVDGVRAAARYTRPIALEELEAEHEEESKGDDAEVEGAPMTLNVDVGVTHFTNRPSIRRASRHSGFGDTTPINSTFNHDPVHNSGSNN